MDEREMRERLRGLQDRHRALDAVLIEPGLVEPGGSASDPGPGDSVGRMRAKKLKLRLRDEIAVLESMLIPDILA